MNFCAFFNGARNPLTKVLVGSETVHRSSWKRRLNLQCRYSTRVVDKESTESFGTTALDVVIVIQLAGTGYSWVESNSCLTAAAHGFRAVCVG